MTVEPTPDPPRIGTPTGDAMVRALRTVPSVLGSARVRQDLLEQPEMEANRLGLPSQAGALLLSIVNAAERQGSRPGEVTVDLDTESDPKVRSMLMQPFGHITWTFRILTAMSVIMFLVGLAFLSVALVKAVNEQAVSTSTIVIAGVGIVDLVVLFYRRPWDDIARGLSNSQQARIIAISYMSGVSMITPHEPNAHATLHTLTREAVELLEQYTEPSPPGKE